MRLSCQRRPELEDNVVSCARKLGWDMNQQHLQDIKVPRLRRFLGRGGQRQLNQFAGTLYQQGRLRQLPKPLPRLWYMKHH